MPTSGGIRTPRPFRRTKNGPACSRRPVLDAFAVRGIERIFLFAPFAIDSGRRMCHRTRARMFHVVKVSISEALTDPAYEVQSCPLARYSDPG